MHLLHTCMFYHLYEAMVTIFRYNKCCLDEINEAGITTRSVEEVHSFTVVTSPPLGTNLVKSVAIGTSHMAAVTGKISKFNTYFEKWYFYGN